MGERTILVWALKGLLSNWLKPVQKGSKRIGQIVDQYFIVFLLVSSNICCG